MATTHAVVRPGNGRESPAGEGGPTITGVRYGLTQFRAVAASLVLAVWLLVTVALATVSQRLVG